MRNVKSLFLNKKCPVHGFGKWMYYAIKVKYILYFITRLGIHVRQLYAKLGESLLSISEKGE